MVSASDLAVQQQLIVNLYTSCFSSCSDPKLFMTRYQQSIVSLKTIIIQESAPSIQKAFFFLLKQLFIFTVYCRDIYGGLGRRDISQSMLFIWNYHFPVPTAKCIHMMVLPLERHPPYGSWRDIKALCLHIRTFSEKREHDPFLDTCIAIMNHQLDQDNTNWANALDKYIQKQNTSWEIPYPVPAETNISLVCKWIPREKSAYGWLFELCAIQFIRAFRPQYLQFIRGPQDERLKLALKKGKKEYRQIISRLSKAWDTVQIKQCNDQWNTIDPEHIPMNAMMSQQQALLNISSKGTPRKNTLQNKDRNLCASKIQAFWLTHKTNNVVFVSMGLIIKKAIRIHSTVEKNRLEGLWNKVLSQIQPMSFVFPILDLSLFVNCTEIFYHYLGMALAVACKSTLFGKEKRLLCFDSLPHFINLTGNGDSGGNMIQSMMSIMKPIYHQHHIGSSIEKACSMFVDTVQKSELKEDDYDKIVLMIFSSYHHSKFQTVQNIFDNAGMKVPTIFWTALDDCGGNIMKECDDKHFFTLNQGPIPIVGYHNHILSQISQIQPELVRHMTPYSFFTSILNNPRYQPIDNYFSGVLQGNLKVHP